MVGLQGGDYKAGGRAGRSRDRGGGQYGREKWGEWGCREETVMAGFDMCT